MEVAQVGFKQQTPLSWETHSHKVGDKPMQDTPMHDFF